MNVLELMDSKASSFSKNDHCIYELIKKMPEVYANESISEISTNFGISKAALTRFAQKLGFSGYSEFQYQFSIDLKSSNDNDKSYIDYLNDFLKLEEKILESYPFENLANRIHSAQHIYTCGASILRPIAEELALSFKITSRIIAMHVTCDDLPIHVSKNDVVIIYSSISGTFYQDFLHRISKLEEQPYVVLVTTNAKHPLRHYANECIVLPTVNVSQKTSSASIEIHEYLLFNEYLLKNINSHLI